MCRCLPVFLSERRGDRGAGEREVITVGGIAFTSGPAWAKRYTARACVRLCLSTIDRCDSWVFWHAFHFSLHPRFFFFFSDSIFFFPKPISPSLCLWLLVLSLLLILPLSALSIANQPANTHARTSARTHTHSQREVFLGAAGYVFLPILTLHLLLYLFPLSIRHAYRCVFTFCIAAQMPGEILWYGKHLF